MATPLPVRLTDSLISRIDSVAIKAGLTRSDVIRLCLSRFLDDFDAAPEELLKRDWSSVLDQYDGRKTRYTAAPPEAADNAGQMSLPSPQTTKLAAKRKPKNAP